MNKIKEKDKNEEKWTIWGFSKDDIILIIEIIILIFVLLTYPW